MAAASTWDVVAVLANLAQLSGLHALMIIAVCASVLRTPECRRECAQLERCARTLRTLLQWPTADFVAVVLQRSMMGNRVGEALDDAAGLVASFHGSTLWRRVREGRTMAAQFGDMQSIIDSYSRLVITVNGLLLVQAAETTRPRLSYSNNITIDVSEQVPHCPTGAETFTSPDRPVLVSEECVVSQIDNAVFDEGCEILTSIS